MDLAEEVVISSLCVAIITLMHYLFMYVTYVNKLCMSVVYHSLLSERPTYFHARMARKRGAGANFYQGSPPPF